MYKKEFCTKWFEIAPSEKNAQKHLKISEHYKGETVYGREQQQPLTQKENETATRIKQPQTKSM